MLTNASISHEDSAGRKVLDLLAQKASYDNLIKSNAIGVHLNKPDVVIGKVSPKQTGYRARPPAQAPPGIYVKMINQLTSYRQVPQNPTQCRLLVQLFYLICSICSLLLHHILGLQTLTVLFVNKRAFSLILQFYSMQSDEFK